MDLCQTFRKLADGIEPRSNEIYEMINSFISTSTPATDAEIGAYLFSTAIRTPKSEEIAGAALALRENMLPVKLSGEAMDTCGTGGSGMNSFNTSTITSFVVSGSGIPVAKHGNRGRSSRSGSADVLEALGIKIDATIELVKKCFLDTSWCFLFAPHYHPATKRVQIARRKIGTRTIFNFLGPLLNPASVKIQIIGVSLEAMMQPMAEALQNLGTKKAMIVRGLDGLDELTLSTKSTIIELKDETLRKYEITPESVGLKTAPLKDICGLEPEQAAEKIIAVFSGEESSYKDITLLNSGAAIYSYGKAQSLLEGVEIARQTIDSGKALAKLRDIQEIFQ